MFHVSNVDDGKSEWNINETHIIIPMIDGDVINKESDKILTSSLTLNSLEGGDQVMLTNALEHSFVIGFDKNLFDTPNFKSDLVIIQNSDFKVLSCNTDLKNSVAYALSCADQDKNEILWQSPKDGIYPNKPILEVRDEIDYQDSLHDIEKNDQINLVNISSDIAPQVPQTNEEILHQEIIIENKNEKSNFIDYLPSAQNNDIVPNLEYLGSSKLNKETDQLKNVKNKLKENLCKDTETVPECNKSESSILVEYLKHKTEEKEIIVNNNNNNNNNNNDDDDNDDDNDNNDNKNTKDLKLEGVEIFKSVSDSLHEKSLPLKKKAKMKRTLTLYSSENQRSLLKQDLVDVNQPVDIKSVTGRKTKQSNPEKEQNQSQINTPLISKVTKRKKATKFKNSSKNPQKPFPNSVVNENTSLKFKEKESPTTKSFEFNKDKFCNIYDLIECLRKCKMINTSIWEILNIGLKEMNVDILKEMNSKKNKKHLAGSYSPQLKAFALVLYFKQPAAFNYLSQVYDTGWPSIKTIKDWKRQINCYHRQIFTKVEKDTDLSS